MSDELDSQSFNKNYKVLKEAADWLSGQKEPDIDQLVPKVEKAMRAYSICKERLDKVQETLGQYFEKDGAGAISSDGDGEVNRVPPPNRPSRPVPQAEEADEDTPF
jgi:exodeoxyribonuclease VII small subunit